MYGDNMRFEYAHFNSMDFGSYGLGASINPVGSQLTNTNTAINWGMQNLELSLGTQMSFQQSGHLAQLGNLEREELIRLAKMNRVNLSVHAGHFCAAGGQGNAISETARLNAIREFRDTLTFADQIGRGSKTQHVPVVIHAVEGVPGNPTPREVLNVIDRESGSISSIEKKDFAYSEDYLKKYKLKKGDNLNGDYSDAGKGLFTIYPEGRLKMKNQEMVESLNYQEASIEYNKDIHKNSMDRAVLEYKKAKAAGGIPPDELEILRANSERQGELYGAAVKQGERTRAELGHFRGKYENPETHEFSIIAKTDDFAKEQAKKTFVQLGFESYNKPSKPMIVIENFSPEYALSSPKMLAETIKDIRGELANKLSKEKGISIEKAHNEASKLIGMNLDIGHVNLWKRYGRDKEMMKEIEIAAPYIKHAHITDNFGDHDAHLPVGWGNAPIKEFLSSLKKHGWKGKAILETFGAMQYGGGGFGIPQSMYGLNASLVPGGPSWESAGNNYFSAGYSFTTGPILPDVNFQTYGVGFSGLPYATGGQIGGGKPGEKFSGTPMS